jgi:hypothetical protein
MHLTELALPNDLRPELHELPLGSFFDFAFLLRFNRYVQLAITPDIAAEYRIGDETLLAWAVLDRNYPMALHLLQLGADPNIRIRLVNESLWSHVLQLARRSPDADEKSKFCDLAKILLEHGADASLLTLEDVRTVFKGLSQLEQDALISQICALKQPSKKGKRDSSTSSSLSVRKAMKQRLSSIFKT